MLAELTTQTTALPEGFTMRPASLADAEPTTAFLNIWSRHKLGAEKFTLNNTQAEWRSPGFDLTNATRLVISPEGQIVGCIEVWDINDTPVSVWVWARVHPKFEGLGIGTALMTWGEGRARQAISRVPPNARVVMHTGCLSKEHATQALFTNLGMEPIRHFWKMRIDFNQPIPQATWPNGITIQTFKEMDDLTKICRAVDDAFKDHWGHVDEPEEKSIKRWQHWVESDENFNPALWFLAMDGEEIAGMSLCTHKDYEMNQLGYVDTLGVRRPWRKQGLGLALLHHSFTEMQNLGKAGCRLDVDASSLTGATRLYEKAGMHVDRQSNTYEKELRPGVDLMTRSVDD